MVVRLPEAERTVTRLQDILVSTPSGAYIPLSQVAEFRTVGGSMNISRENGVACSRSACSSATVTWAAWWPT